MSDLAPAVATESRAPAPTPIEPAAAAAGLPEQDAFGGLGHLLAGLFVLWFVIVTAVAVTV